MKFIKKALCLILVLVLALSLSVSAYAAGSTIDQGQTASLDIYKYDLTRAEQDGVWDAASHVSTGTYDGSVISTLGGDAGQGTSYAIQGVKYSYLKLGSIDTYSQNGEAGAYNTTVLYGLPEGNAAQQFLSAIGLSYANAHHSAAGDGVNIHYFNSDTLISALASAINGNSTTVKNAMESLVAANGGVTLAETDAQGHTSATGLPLGLYLVVETSVPENVTSTTDPFLVSLPMTTIDGTGWNYSVVVYPKNRTGMPTLEKTLRESKAHTGTNGGTNAITDGYAHTGTASDGDVIEYQIISKLPTITSAASALTEYTFADTLSGGLKYNQGDVKIEFFKDESCAEAVTSWTQADQKFNVSYSEPGGGSTMTITMTPEGLSEINTSADVYGVDGSQRGYSGCTMRITYAATMHSDASVVYGEQGNPNTVQLTWRRTNGEYYDVLNDDCHVYTFGVDLTKEFSDGAGSMDSVKMVVHNDTDGYYVQASQQDGIYYVTGHAADEQSATIFTPTAEGKIVVKGLENDSYSITEKTTAAGYVLLKDAIQLVISTADGEMCGTCDAPKKTASAAIDGNSVDMAPDGASAHALVPLKVVNVKGFNLPQTGSHGTWIYTSVGILIMACAVVLMVVLNRRRPAHRSARR